MIHKVFSLNGTDAQNAIVSASIDRITFPWATISALQVPIPVGFRNLNGTAAQERLASRLSGSVHEHPNDPTKIPGHLHVPGPNGEPGHGVVRYFDAEEGMGERWWTAGVFWWGGGRAGIDIDTRCEAQPAVGQEVFAAEAGHFADLGIPYSQAMKDGLTRLLHPGGLDAHTYWWPEDVGLPYGGDPYYACMGETNMGIWTAAYSDMKPWQDAFPHKMTPEMVPKVHEILGVHPVGPASPPMPPAPPPPPPEPPPVAEHVFSVKGYRTAHRPTCFFIRRARTFRRTVIDHPSLAASGLNPCRTCKPT